MDLSPAADAEPIQAVWLQRLGLADRAARTSLRLLDLHSGAPQVVWLGLRVRARARVRARVRVTIDPWQHGYQGGANGAIGLFAPFHRPSFPMSHVRRAIVCACLCIF